MLEAEFVRDLRKHYIVLKGIEGKATAYSTRMLLNNQIPGLLKTELRCIDQTDLFYYDITSKKSLAAFCENKALNHKELKNILTGMLNVIENSGDYLLLENDFIMDPNYIFINGDTLEIGFCHLPGSQEQIQEQLSKLMEYLMNKVDYKDEAAVVLIYAMYKTTKEPDCTYATLLKELEKKTEPKVKKIIIDTELSAGNSKPSLIGGSEKLPVGETSVNKRQEPLSNSLERKQGKSTCVGAIDNTPQPGRKKSPKTKQLSEKQKQHSQIQKQNQIQKQQNQIQKQHNQKQKQQNQLQKQRRNNKLQVNQMPGSTNRETETFLKQNAGVYAEKFQALYKVIVESCFGKKMQTDRNADKNILRDAVVSEREYQYFRPLTFVLAGITVMAGIFLLIGALYLKLLHNAFGTHIDGTKLFSCIIIISCLIVYIFIKLFDSKNKITGIRTEEEEPEYEDPKYEDPAMAYSKARESKIKYSKVKNYDTENYHLVNNASESYATESYASESYASESHDSESYATESKASEGYETESYDTEHKDKDSFRSDDYDAESHEAKNSITQNFAVEDSKNEKAKLETIFKEIKNKGILPDKDGVYEYETGFPGYDRTDAEQSRYTKRGMKTETMKGEASVAPKRKEIDPSEGETQLLWMEKADSSQNATVILSMLSPKKLYGLTTVGKELKQDVMVRDFPFYIGKLRKGVDLTIDDKSVSRRHARLTKAGEDIFLTDLNSTNGTYINNIKLQENKAYLLTDRDKISFSQIDYIWNEDL